MGIADLLSGGAKSILRSIDCTKMGQNTSKNCIIVHVLGRIREKVHYNAVFGVEILVGKMEINCGLRGGISKKQEV
jgi:hypothetical protein